MASATRVDVLNIAGFMATSEEWAANYADASDADFVAAVYANVLGRGYDQAGYEYWLGLLSEGEGPSRHDVVF